MSTNRTSRLRRLGAKAALLAAIPALWLLPAAADQVAPSHRLHSYDKDWYDSQPPDTHPNETAAWFDPDDPVPGIGFGCRGAFCGPPHPPAPHGPVLPGLLGHNVFLVDCGKWTGVRPREHKWRHRDHRDGVFSSIDEAAQFAPPNSTILILPPGQGTTCRESIFVNRPLTIATYGGGEQAVIEAPEGEPCLIANIALGDALTIDGVRFIARADRHIAPPGDAPCISVRAGRVVVKNSSIDSRGTNWAFDVGESGELAVDGVHVETDLAGIHARRAKVELHNLDIDIESRSSIMGRNGEAYLGYSRMDCTGDRHPQINGSVGLVLECTDGYVEGGSIIGGALAVAASPGTRSLRLTDLKITKPDTGILLLPGQLGTIRVERPVISNAWDGIVVAPGAESEITGAVITDSLASGVMAYGAGVMISGSKIIGANDGIELYPVERFPNPPPILESSKAPDFADMREHRDPVPPFVPGDGRVSPLARDFGRDFGGPTVENNLIANVQHAAIMIAGGSKMHGRVIGNTFYARPPAHCIAGENDDPIKVHSNACNREWFTWRFTTGPLE